MKNLNTELQRYSKLFDNIKIDPSTDIMTLESSQNEHLEIDDKRILLPERLNSLVIGRFHKNPQSGHFATGITKNKVLNHFWMPRTYPTVTEFISKCLECELKKKSVIHRIKTQ